MSLSITLPRADEAHHVHLNLPGEDAPISWRVYVSPKLGLAEVRGTIENMMNVILTPRSLLAITKPLPDESGVEVQVHPAPFNPEAGCLDKASLMVV